MSLLRSGSASDWMTQISNQSEALSNSKQWHVISMEFLRSFLGHHFAWKPPTAPRNVGCFPKLQLFPKKRGLNIEKTDSETTRTEPNQLTLFREDGWHLTAKRTYDPLTFLKCPQLIWDTWIRIESVGFRENQNGEYQEKNLFQQKIAYVTGIPKER